MAALTRKEKLRRLTVIGLLCFTAALLGCGGKSSGDVSGEVTFQGKRLVFGSVVIFGSDQLPRQGEIKPDGTYTVTGIPVGEGRIAVHSPDPGEQPKLAPDPRDKRKPPPKLPASRDRSKWFAIPEHYGDPEKSRLTITIQEGSNSHNIELRP